MGEDYYSMNREELIEKIKEMTAKYDKWKDDFKCMYEKEMTEQHKQYEELKNNFEKYKIETQGIQNIKFENKSLKDAIVAMAMYCFPGISNIDRNILDIKENLRNISKGR